MNKWFRLALFSLLGIVIASLALSIFAPGNRFNMNVNTPVGNVNMMGNSYYQAPMDQRGPFGQYGHWNNMGGQMYNKMYQIQERMGNR